MKDPVATADQKEVGGARHALGAKARTGTAWIVVGFGGGQVLRLAVNIVLAALLFEEAFALMAIVAAVLQGLSMFSDIGLRPSVVQNERGDESSFLNTAWTMQVIRGAVLCLVAALLAWPISALYAANDPMAHELKWLIPLVALGAFVDGFQSSRMLTAARQIQLKRTTLIEMVVQVFNAIVMLGLAWAFRSVYALAFAAVLSSGLRTALTYWMLPGLPSRFMLEPAAVRSILSFGKWIFVSTLLSFLAMQIDRLVLAGFFPLAEVGVYAIAVGLAMLVTVLVGTLQSSVVFPWYARMLDDGVELGEAFRKTRAPILLMSTFIASLMVVGAASLFELAYDDRYRMAGVYLPLLAIGGWFSCLESMYGAAFLATGRSRWVAWVSFVKVLSFALMLIPLVYFEWSLVVATAMVLASEVLRAAASQYLGRQLGLRNLKIETAMLLLLLVSSGIGLWVTEHFAPVANLHPAWRLLVVGLLMTSIFAPAFVRVLGPLIKWRQASGSRQSV